MKQLTEHLGPNNFILWITIAVGFKLLQTFIMSPTIRTTGDNFYAALGDTPFYVDVTKGMINEGEYYYKYHEIFFGPVRKISEDNTPPEANAKLYSYRMPGYPILLYPFMQLFEVDKALDIVAFLQLIFTAISVYFLAYLMYVLTKNKWAFHFTFFLYLLSFYVAKWSTYIMTESFSVSMLITLFLFCALVSKGRKFSPLIYFAISLGITLAIFMRPFFVPFYGLVVLYFLYLTYRKRITIVALIFFVVPPLASEATWVIRNKMVSGRVVLLEDTLQYFEIGNQTLKEWTGFVISIGGNKLYWEGKSHGRWLLPQWYFEQAGEKRPPDEIWPDWIRNEPEKFNRLLAIREKYATTLDTSVDLNYRLELEKQNIQEIAELKEMVRDEKPFLFYIGSRIKIFLPFINQVTDVSYNSLRFPINIFYSAIGPAINTLVMYCGSLALLGFLLFYNRKIFTADPVALIIYFVPLFLIIFLQIIMGEAENRHLTYIYPFLLFGLVYYNWLLYHKSKLGGFLVTILLGFLAIGSSIYHLLYYVKW